LSEKTTYPEGNNTFFAQSQYFFYKKRVKCQKYIKFGQ